MAKSAWRKIYVSFWNDETVSELSPLAKLIFLGVLTHPLINALGAIRQSPQGLAFDLGVPYDRNFKAAFASLAPAAIADPKRPLIWARNFLKYNPPDNPNIVKSWLPMLNQLPECETKRDILRAAELAATFRGAETREAFAETFAEYLAPEPEYDRVAPENPPDDENPLSPTEAPEPPLGDPATDNPFAEPDTTEPIPEASPEPPIDYSKLSSEELCAMVARELREKAKKNAALANAHAGTPPDTHADTHAGTPPDTHAGTRPDTHADTHAGTLKSLELIKDREEKRRRLIENDSSKSFVVNPGYSVSPDFAEMVASFVGEASGGVAISASASQRRPEAASASQRYPEAASAKRYPEKSQSYPDGDWLYPSPEKASNFHSLASFGREANESSSEAKSFAKSQTGADKAASLGSAEISEVSGAIFERLDCQDGVYAVTVDDRLAYEACYPEIGDWSFLFRQMKAKLYAVPSSRPKLENAPRWVNCFIRNAASDALRDAKRQRRVAR